MDKLNALVDKLGKNETARQLRLSSGMLITGWQRRNKIPNWRIKSVDLLAKKILDR